MCSTDIFLGLLAILFPPLPVWVKTGICSADSFINILLCLLGFLPGLIHAWYIIAKHPEPDWDYQAYDSENSRVYVIVQGAPNQQHPHAAHPQRQQPRPQHPAHGGMSYGTTGPGPSSSVPAPHAGESSRGGDVAPPSYAQVVAGDNKIQTQD